MKKIVLVFALILSVTVSAKADTKIAVFDVKVVIDTIEEGKKASATLDKEFLAKKKDIEAKGKELEKLKQDLDSSSLVLSKEAMAKKQKELQDKALNFQKLQIDAQKEFQNREMSLTGEIFNKINAVIQKLGKDGNYDFIFEKNQGAVTYFKSGDITQQVISEYNKAYSGKK
jgi:outer membrane protein